MGMKKKKLLFNERELKCIKQAKAFLAADLTHHLTTDALASHVGISSVKLKYGFRQLYGTSIYQFLLQCRIERAKELLRDKDSQVKVVAVQCGFKNVQHFITCFKRLEKVTPGRFQKDCFQ